MSQTNTSGFCVNCGEPIDSATRFCVNCGAERAIAPSTPPAVASLPPSSLPPQGSTPSPNRNRAILAGVIVGLVVVGVAGAVWAKSSGSDHKSRVAVAAATSAPVTSPAQTAPSPTEPTTTQVTQTTSASDIRSVVSHVDTTLIQSAAQVGELKAIIAQFDPGSTPNSAQPCGLFAAAAAARVQSVIDGRKSIVSDLDRLAVTAGGTDRLLVTSLRAAMDLSLQSDYVYQAWIGNNSSTDATNPCQRVHDANWRSSQAIAPRASAAKQAFLAAYLPVAARLGVRADWKYTDF